VCIWDIRPTYFMFIWFEMSIWDTKRIQMKSCQLQEFVTF
jgi:hypothetical protein